MMRRQRSRRRMSRNHQDDPEFVSAAAAAARVQYEDGEPVHDLPHLQNNNDETTKPGSRSSWYNDVLTQGGTEELNAILQASEASAAAEEQNNHRNDEDEVLEQYRIMAHVEASIRVKDNTGFDMADYVKKRKLHPEPNKLDYFDGSRKPKAYLPQPKILGGGGNNNSNNTMMQPDEPPLPAPRPNRRYLEQKKPLVPDLCDGVIIRGGSSTIPEEDEVSGMAAVVRCLGCKTQLRTNLLATLVNCPECSTVSPATTTRR
eukprot:scaffold2189_cov116-Cylindrotheca_fusiformis.AAC.10